MKAKSFLWGILLVVGLALYLWPALAAPVVLWSDSQVDLDWARRGVGIFRTLSLEDRRTASVHPLKPGYVLFLRLAGAALPSLGETRSIVLVQSLLLWSGIALTSYHLGRRRGFRLGITLYVLLIGFLRLRDSASAIMSGAPAAALLLPIAAGLFELPKGNRNCFLLGLGIAVLFWIRPNVAAVALVFGLLAWILQKRWRPVVLLSLAFVAGVLPIWIASSLGRERDPARGLPKTLLLGSLDYCWTPALGLWPQGATERDTSREALRRTLRNWRETLELKGPDARRQFVWKMMHGLLGTEFYDARWSERYKGFDTLVRILTPFILLSAIAVLLSLPFRGTDAAWNISSLLLLFLLVLHNFSLGSIPRYLLPFLPVLLLLGMAGLPHLATSMGRRLAALSLLVALLALAAMARGSLDWEWGQVEAAGVKLWQRIPRGSLPTQEPATLHIRIAPVSPATDAHLVVRANSQQLYESTNDTKREMPQITIPLPASLLEQNRRAPVDLELVSLGSYGPSSYLLFPVVPPPWGTPARRSGSDQLSPSVGIASGSLDWWAHAGAP